MGTFTFRTIYLGKLGIQDWDTQGGNKIVENRGSFKDYDSSARFGNKLFQQARSVTVKSNNPLASGKVFEDSTGDGYPAGTVTWTENGVTKTQVIDSFIDANVTFTFTDGTKPATTPQSARFMQTLAGETFLLSYDFPSTNYTAKPLAKIFVNSVGGDYDWLIEHEYNDRAFPCFTRGTQIETSRGLMAVKDLCTGDLVATRDNGLQEIRWIGNRMLPAAVLEDNPNLRPIRIRAGALGKGLPKTDLIVSPQHRILIRSKIAKRMFSTDEVLVAARQLLEIDGIEVAGDLAEVEYFHILFDRHEVVFSNGAEAESLYTGSQALKWVGSAAREEIFTLFPELRDQDPENLRPAARMLVPGRTGRQLAARHSKNKQDLVGAV